MEVLPPAALMDVPDFVKRLTAACQLNVDAVSLPDNPLAQARVPFWALMDLLRELPVDPIVHVAGGGRARFILESTIMGILAGSFAHLLCVGGDGTDHGGHYPDGGVDVLRIALGLRQRQRGGLFKPLMGAGCNPYGLPSEKWRERSRLGSKIREGADFIITQPIFFAQDLMDFLSDAPEVKGSPLVAGLLWVGHEREVQGLKHWLPHGVTMAPYQRALQDRHNMVPYLLGEVRKLRPWIRGVYLSAADPCDPMCRDLIDGLKDLD